MNKSWILNWMQVNETVTDLYIYDDISPQKSRDPWTGEEGNEITAQSVVEMLDGVTTPEIRVHINSAGGDVFESVAISQAIQSTRQKGKKIFCQIDGICASAAVNVALACSPIQIPKNAYMMIHDPASVLIGIFNADTLRKTAEQLDVVKRGIVAGYAEKTGLPTRELERMMAAEKWMTGEEAIAAHFADELLPDPVSIQKDSATQNILVNGRMVNTTAYDNLPTPLKCAEAVNKKGGVKLEHIRTVDNLKAQYPELCNQLESAAKEAGRLEERARLQAIDEVATVVSADMINAAKYETPSDAKELLFQAAKQGQLVNRVGAAVLAGMAQDAQAVNQVPGTINGGANNFTDPKTAKVVEAESAVTRALNHLGLKSKNEK